MTTFALIAWHFGIFAVAGVFCTTLTTAVQISQRSLQQRRLRPRASMSLSRLATLSEMAQQPSLMTIRAR